MGDGIKNQMLAICSAYRAILLDFSKFFIVGPRNAYGGIDAAMPRLVRAATKFADPFFDLVTEASVVLAGLELASKVPRKMTKAVDRLVKVAEFCSNKYNSTTFKGRIFCCTISFVLPTH